ncbi:MAG: alpha/beta hydrolase family protein [Verrucomicrobiota bacterium]
MIPRALPLMVLALAFSTVWTSAQTLPGTQPLEANPDFSATMVAGIDKMALRLIEESKSSRKPTRDKLKAAIGLVDERVPIKALEFIGDTESPALLMETDLCRVFRVRWPVFNNVHGEGLYIQPKSKPHARVIYMPDASSTPEKLVDEFLLTTGCEIVIPALLSRESTYSTNDKFNVKTNLAHREWIYRQSYELGRHIIGYEVQKVLSLVDWFNARSDQVPAPVLVAGVGEGGMLALYAAAVDERIDCVYSAGYFAPRESVWAEPIYRNVFGLLRDFGDAEIASLIAPRPVSLQFLFYPKLVVSKEAPQGVRAISAPGRLGEPDFKLFQAEVEKANKLAPTSRIQVCTMETNNEDIIRHLFPAATADGALKTKKVSGAKITLKADATRQERLVRELEAFTQRLLVTTEMERKEQFWNKLPMKSMPEYEAHTDKERERFWNEVIGRLPDPNLPMNAKSRFVRETEKVVIYEVTLDVWQDVFAWGWLCLPKEILSKDANGQLTFAATKRPVIVCQHGLEGLPEDTITTDEKQKGYGPYKGFTYRLAEMGFITFAPHNPYRGLDNFRTLQRKLNPLGLTLYSVINGQHQRVLEWLKAQPFTQADKIAFYGLSYGGKSAMRTPAVLKDYCLSICSGDFNEWVRKCVCTDIPMNYTHTHEYEIWEWNMGRTFNYAEMAALIAPRPFMVERGHNDGVGIDEWVNYEFAKVRRLYNKLLIGDRTTIEHFDGPHTIHGVGTYQFLRDKLEWR